MILMLGVFAIMTPALAQVPGVVVSIKPIHSLVAGVMTGVGEPHLIVKGAASPHTFALRPSDARALENADVVFWVGETVEPFLTRPLQTIGAAAHSIELIGEGEVRVLAAREGGAWGASGHTIHGPARHRDARSEHDREHLDGHIWLDPRNATAVTRIAVRVLAALDPGNAVTYRRNGDDLAYRLSILEAELTEGLRPIREVPYAVFHDAYQYLEQRYGLNAIGAISTHTGRAPGARSLQALRTRIIESDARCVFHEPQFDPKLVETLIGGTDVSAGVLDSMGAKVQPGAEAYFRIMRDISAALSNCLRGER